MRKQGRITKWKDDQGFGFITPRGGGDHVFVHIKAFLNRNRRPVGDEMVTYEVTSDIKGRLRAVDVQFVGDRYEVSTNSRGIFLVIPSLFVATVTGLVVTELLPVVVLAVYLVASVVSFVVYAGDKAASRTDGWRTAEKTLHEYLVFAYSDGDRMEANSCLTFRINEAVKEERGLDQIRPHETVGAKSNEVGSFNGLIRSPYFRRKLAIQLSRCQYQSEKLFRVTLLGLLS